MPDTPNEAIYCDYNGVPKVGQFPRYVQAQRFTGNTDNTADATWSFTYTGSLVATIADGLLTITDCQTDSIVTITSDYDGISVSKTFSVLKSMDGPPLDAPVLNSFSSFNSTSDVAISDEISVLVGAGGNNRLQGCLRGSADAAAPTGNTLVYYTWYYWDGAAWAVATTETSINVNVSALGAGYRCLANSTANLDHSHTGRAPGTTDRYKLYARHNGGGAYVARDIYSIGSASVTSS